MNAAQKITIIDPVPSKICRARFEEKPPKKETEPLPRLDEADVWLLANDPEYRQSGIEEAARRLSNLRRRQNHRIGGVIWEDSLEAEASECDVLQGVDDSEPFNHGWLSQIAKTPGEKRLVSALTTCTSLAEAGRSLGITRQAANKTFKRLLCRARMRGATV